MVMQNLGGGGGGGTRTIMAYVKMLNWEDATFYSRNSLLSFF